MADDRDDPLAALVAHGLAAVLSEGAGEEFFADSPLETVAEFVEGPIDYIGRKKKHDYKG